MVKDSESRKHTNKSINAEHSSSLRYVLESAYELYQGMRIVSRHKKAITFFGSARETLPQYYYESCEILAANISKKGFTVISGGGKGIMRSANKGAYKSGGQSIGITIQIPREEVSNRFLLEEKSMKYFFTRKKVLSYASQIYIFFPGGFGTLDELADMLVLIQTEKIPRIPIILFGRDFWTPFDSLVKKIFIETYKTVSKGDDSIYTIVDNVEEAMLIIEKNCE